MPSEFFDRVYIYDRPGGNLIRVVDMAGEREDDDEGR